MRPDRRIRDGKRSELIAADWLLSQNCYVYQPFVEQGPIDLIALSPTGELLCFDVKTVGRRKNGSIISRLLKEPQQKLGVRLLYVDLETGQCALYPHQLEAPQSNFQKSAQRVAEQNASNRHFGGGKVPTISSLLRQGSEQTTRSSPVASSQCVRPPYSSSLDPHTEPNASDQSGAPDPQTEPESQD